jgi:hypothetical protein
MCCPLFLIAFFGPRVALVYLWLTGYLQGVFATLLWPLLGFIFMPYTTLVYAIDMHYGGVRDLGLVALIVAVIIDLSVHGGSEHQRRGRRITD